MPQDAVPNLQADADQLEAATDRAIAACGGNAREAVRALIVANEFLESEVCEELSPKVGDGGNREGGISWGCLTPPLLHQRSDMPCPTITSPD